MILHYMRFYFVVFNSHVKPMICPMRKFIRESIVYMICVYGCYLGTLKVRAEAAGVTKKEDSKDADLVFVAGATGRVGSRTVRCHSLLLALLSTVFFFEFDV